MRRLTRWALLKTAVELQPYLIKSIASVIKLYEPFVNDDLSRIFSYHSGALDYECIKRCQ